MKKLLSLPPNLVSCFHDINHVEPKAWYCTSDPVNARLGSGGGTTWLLESCYREESNGKSFEDWLKQEKRILLHAGGQSRRLPSYAPSGKILTPIPVFRWERGQELNQNLLSLQLPLYEQIIEKAPQGLRTLIASGDVYIRATGNLQTIPDADVVCYGLWAEPELAKNHGVFVIDRQTPEQLDYMLQKPSTETLSGLMETHIFLMDIGIWLLSDKAVNLLRKQSKANDTIKKYDLYSDFGCALGNHPSMPDEELNDLKIAILPLPGGEFYHFGTSRELLSSTTAIQNLVKDQRFIIQKQVKHQPSIFTQNAIIECPTTELGENSWIENSYVPSTWKFSEQNIVTGVPENNWHMSLPTATCIDIVPVRENEYVLRPYGFNDRFSGSITDATTLYLGIPVTKWLASHHIEPEWLNETKDLQESNLFPICSSIEEMGELLAWMITIEPTEDLSAVWKQKQRISANEISNIANLHRLEKQRNLLRKQNLPTLAANYRKSVFYQVNLSQIANDYVRFNLPLPDALSEEAPLLTRMRDSMFRSIVKRNQGIAHEEDEAKAFQLLREGLTVSALTHKVNPVMNVYGDQIVWGRSSVRIDLAGGWTDTPPYSLSNGGSVVNLAIELNGQPPLQVYVKPCNEPVIICRSIDLGAMERIETYEELVSYNKVGSPFSIPKAALCLVGFSPDFSLVQYATLREQLQAFGCGIEITLLSAIPAGSGLGTSSILSATVLGALADFCGLGFDKSEICNRTLVLEQLLTTGGGWQDQYGGVLEGVKLLQTAPGFDQTPVVRWLPENIFKQDEYKACHLLYYTGITRTAKDILAEIVQGMFLNNTKHLSILKEMKSHALEMHDAIQKSDFLRYGELLRHTWTLNKRLDAGTNPASVEKLSTLIDDYSLGYKLPGAGGGGYMYMVAKDPQAALLIRKILQENPIAPNARFVEMSLSQKGLQVSRS